MPKERTTVGAPGSAGPRSTPLRIMIVQEQDMVRRGLGLSLGAEAGIVLCGEAPSLEEAVDKVVEAQPDAVIADVHLAYDAAGIHAARALREAHPQAHLLFLTSFAGDDALLATILAGASGYVLKQVNGSTLVADLRRVVDGENLLGSFVIGAALERLARLLAGHTAAPSADDAQVLALMGRGETNQKIANHLGVPSAEVERHVSALLSKWARVRAGRLGEGRDGKTASSEPPDPVLESHEDPGPPGLKSRKE